MCHRNHMACRSLDGCLSLCIWKTERLLIMSEIARQLTSVTFSLSSFHSLFLSLSLVHSLFFLPHCPHFQSILTTYLSHHSNCSLRHSSSSFHSSVGEWKGWDGWKWGRGRRRGRFVRFGGLMRSERCCFGSRNLSCNMHPIDPLKGLPIQQKLRDDSSSSANWAMGVWCDGRENSLKTHRYHLQPSSCLFYPFSSTSLSYSSMSAILSEPPSS